MAGLQVRWSDEGNQFKLDEAMGQEGDVVVHGSAQLVRSLEIDLVEELRLLVF